MKNIFYFLSLALIVASCSKEVPGLTVDEYITANNLQTTELAEGVHIVIKAPGDGNKPNINSNFEISYVGMLTDGTVFDSSTSYKSTLAGVVKGWQIGVPEIGIGGSCTLIIPAEAGYGENGQGSIPGNATLVFDIELIDIFL